MDEKRKRLLGIFNTQDIFDGDFCPVSQKQSALCFIDPLESPCHSNIGAAFFFLVRLEIGDGYQGTLPCIFRQSAQIPFQFLNLTVAEFFFHFRQTAGFLNHTPLSRESRKG